MRYPVAESWDLPSRFELKNSNSQISSIETFEALSSLSSFKISFKMADKEPKRTVEYTTTNSQGNTTTQYSDGAYRYSNKGTYIFFSFDWYLHFTLYLQSHSKLYSLSWRVLYTIKWVNFKIRFWYSEPGSEGKTTSNYFNDGKGHGFTNVNSSGTRGSENYKAPYSHSTNYNAGTRTYNPKKWRTLASSM